MWRLSLLLLLFLWPASSPAETVRLLVSIGANVGDPDDAVLRFADDDAARMRQVFVELGGVRADRASVLVDASAQDVRQKLAEVAGRIAELRGDGHDPVLVVYVSSHAKAGVLHLSGSHLPLAELRDTARKAGARLTVVVVDACESGTLAQKKGGRAAPAYDVALEKLPLHGQVVISSSGPAEVSEEWDSLQGSLFTHHLLTGLRGDADADSDGKVSLSEAYAYSYRRTVAGAAGAGQHPAYALELAGTGELVLTEPAGARSALVFPAAASGRYVVSSRPRPDVVAEVEKQPGRPLRIAVPPGRYLVRKRAGASTGLLEVELPFGGERQVNEAALEWRRYQEVAVKGGALDLKNAAVLALGRWEGAAIPGTGTRLSAALGYRHTRGAWWALGTVSGTRASYRGQGLDIREGALGLGLSAGYRWMEWALVPQVGLSLELTGLRQSFRRDREDDIQGTLGLPALASRNTLGVAAGPVVGVEVPLPGPTFALVQGQLLVRYLPPANERVPPLRLAPSAMLGAGYRF
ncbi:caspase family protein [Pyxidicoccus xibeiensis]|uniref:caspase family protein n=1 Tax=Pyxidicoccus xibeiensis TaxID=2906759 RepID=UPI0020A72545|nr:caspase family protein [Pyxidicoccus xibeiensis]MCP3141830.1 caspase family protein [Pyxidicoccus xibeiensis]